MLGAMLLILQSYYVIITKVAVNLEGASFKSQMKKADKSCAKIALIIGDDEVVKKSIKIKLLREEVSQEYVFQKYLLSYLKSIK